MAKGVPATQLQLLSFQIPISACVLLLLLLIIAAVDRDGCS
jgi:hypothetical protein